MSLLQQTVQGGDVKVGRQIQISAEFGLLITGVIFLLDKPDVRFLRLLVEGLLIPGFTLAALVSTFHSYRDDFQFAMAAMLFSFPIYSLGLFCVLRLVGFLTHFGQGQR